MAARAADGAKLMQGQVVEAAQENVRKLRSHIESNPLTTAGIALAVGVLLGALVRR